LRESVDEGRVTEHGAIRDALYLSPLPITLPS
jgi:hypothetical protein